MNDPKPENIHGSKKRIHTVKWEINVSYILLGLVAFYIISKLISDSEGNVQDNSGREGNQEQDYGVNGGGPTG